jgi:S1-C subfamily serine protease
VQQANGGTPIVTSHRCSELTLGSRAEELGFRKGDLVNAIERQVVTSLVDLRKIMNKSEPKIKRVGVVRGVEKLEFKLSSSSI